MEVDGDDEAQVTRQPLMAGCACVHMRACVHAWSAILVCGNIALLTSVVSMICSLYFSPFPVPPSPVKVTCCATWPCIPVAIAIDGNQKLVGDPATDLLVEPTSEGVDLFENEGGRGWCDERHQRGARPPPSLPPTLQKISRYLRGIYGCNERHQRGARPPPLPPKKKRKQRLREEYAEEYEVDCI